MKIFINHEFTESDKKAISIEDRGLLLGDGIFTTLQSVNLHLKYFAQHIERLHRHAALIDLKIPLSESEIKAYCEELLRQNQLENETVLIRITVTRGKSERGINISKNIAPTIFIKCTKLAHSTVHPKLCFTSVIRNEYSAITRIKSLNYLEPILARKEAQDRGFDDGIMLNTHGAICECSTANIFFVTSNYEVLTPHLSEGVLDGIIRANVISSCKALNIPILQRSIKPEDIYDCIEAFQTNCAIGIQSIKSIEDMEFHYIKDSVTQLIQDYCKI
jgi:branched-chain amino acid aminotransferase